KRMDTGEAMIVAVTTGQLKAPLKYGPGQPVAPGQPILPGQPVSWNGTNAFDNGARHLGIPDGSVAVVAILTDDFGSVSGSGFGHKSNVEGAGQRYAWRGQEIAKTMFEIAVTADNLTDDEKKLLVDEGRAGSNASGRR